MYKNIFDESELEMRNDDEVGLRDRNYHIHKKDLDEGRVPMEVSTLYKIAEEIGFDLKSLSDRQLFLCYEYIFECIQLGYELREEENK